MSERVSPLSGHDPILLTKREAAAYLRIGLTKFNELLARGDVRCVRMGRLVRIKVRALQDYIERLECEQSDAA